MDYKIYVTVHVYVEEQLDTAVLNRIIRTMELMARK